MKASRQVIVILTPLLDLLLIVIFAQFIEVQINARKLAEQTERERARYEQAKWGKDLELREARQTRDLALTFMKELFELPEGSLEALAQRAGPDSPGLSPAQIEQLRREAKKLAAMNTAEVIHHLVTFDELRKRADLWEVYVRPTGVAQFDAAGQRHEFRIGTPQETADELFKIYKTLPQTKSLVVLLASYGDTRFKDRVNLQQALPLAVEQMRSDSDGRSRFEYALIGFRPPTE